MIIQSQTVTDSQRRTDLFLFIRAVQQNQGRITVPSSIGDESPRIGVHVRQGRLRIAAQTFPGSFEFAHSRNEI
jgi:hypothetical protein